MARDAGRGGATQEMSMDLSMDLISTKNGRGMT